MQAFETKKVFPFYLDHYSLQIPSLLHFSMDPRLREDDKLENRTYLIDL
jgi:hypothetical protein